MRVVLVELGLLLGRDGLAQVGLGVVGVQVRLELGSHAVRVGERDIASRGSSEEVRVVGNSLIPRTIDRLALDLGGERRRRTHLGSSGGVEDTEKLLEVVRHESVEENLKEATTSKIS